MFWHGLTRTRRNQDDLATNVPYQFQPLSASTTIRLIKVLPKKVKGYIACRIFHVDEKQQEAIKYHALSYVWGDAQQTRQIYLQDEGNQGNEWRPFPLHENLWRFLNHAWRSKLFDQLFWTDYLCLDQKGHEEISQQVPRMHAIYRNAELVVIWLQLNKDDQKGLRKVVRWRGDRPKCMPKVLHMAMQEDLQKRLYEVGRRCGRLKLMPEILYNACERLSVSEEAMYGVMDNSYWGRIWIVQEVVMAKKVRVTAGDISIALDELRVLADPFLYPRHWANHLQPSMWLLCEMRAAGGKTPLWRILSDFRLHKSSRDVDRVFGMLGMVEDHDDGTSPAENIQVDYDKSMWQVLLDAIFESSPPLAEYITTISCLKPQYFDKGFSLLKHYIRHDKTTGRHRHLARVALETFEAFSIIRLVPGGNYAGDSMGSLVDDLFSSAAKTDWKPTLRQSAALIGLLLSSWSMEKVSKRILDPRSRGKGHRVSPWRCAAHGSHDGTHTGLGSYEIVADVSMGELESMVDACGQQSESCKGSIMAFEISDIGLRLQVEPGVSLLHKSHLRLYCLKTVA